VLTEFPDQYATAVGAGVGFMFLVAVWSLCVNRFVSWVRKLTRLGEDV
jgi:hypothetical protein